MFGLFSGLNVDSIMLDERAVMCDTGCLPKRASGAMHVVRIVSRRGDREYVSHLLRQSYRDGAKVKNRTLANRSALPPTAIEVLRRSLAGEVLIGADEALTIERSWPHGHVAAILGAARQRGLEALLDRQPSRQRDLVLAMVVARVVPPASKLATSRLFGTTSLGPVLGVEQAREDELYGALDWLLARQQRIEQRLAQRDLEPGGLVLYDRSSTLRQAQGRLYVAGEPCSLAKRGYRRDGRPDQAQVEFGLLTNAAGVPVAIEAFAGNTGDPATFQNQVQKVKDRFGVAEVIWVADRGMLTSAQVAKLQEGAGSRWSTALRAPAVRKLVEAGSLQLSLFDTQNLAEVTDPAYPDERLVVCFNPLLAERRARKREGGTRSREGGTRSREALLQATERELTKIVVRVERGGAGARGGLQGEGKIGERVGRVVNRYDMAKHFTRRIPETSFTCARDEVAIAEAAALDGFYVLRTNVAPERLDTPGVVLAYKSLAQVEAACRHFKLSDLEVRPIYHSTEPRVRAHLFLCMLAYGVQRSMQRALAPLLFVDEAPPERPDPVAPAPRSAEANRKAQTQLTADGLPVHRCRTLLAHLGTLVKNRVVPRGAAGRAAFELLTQPTKLQTRAFELLGLSLKAM